MRYHQDVTVEIALPPGFDRAGAARFATPRSMWESVFFAQKARISAGVCSSANFSTGSRPHASADQQGLMGATSMDKRGRGAGGVLGAVLGVVAVLAMTAGDVGAVVTCPDNGNAVLPKGGDGQDLEVTGTCTVAAATMPMAT